MTRSTTAVVPAEKATVSAAELTAMLQESGMAEQAADRIPRLKFENGTLIAPDTGEMFVYNPMKPDVPMVTVRLLGPADEYFGIWIDDAMAEDARIPQHLVGKQSKKYLHDEPGRRVWESDEYYGALIAAGYKGSWKGDLRVQIIPESGELTGNETTYLLTLPTTSLIDFKGTSRAPEKGAVSEYTFVHRLGMLAMENTLAANPDATKDDLKRAVINAMESFRLGGVAAEIRTAKMENTEKKTSWLVLVFTPVHIEPIAQEAALPSGEEPTDAVDPEDVPF